MTPEETERATRAVKDLKRILQQKTGYETLEETVGPDKVWLLGRIPVNAGQQWVLVKHALLLATEQTPWKVDISKKYFLRKPGQKIVYAWRLIFQGENLIAQLPQVSNVIAKAPRPNRVELTEVPLGQSGISYDQNTGRGARPIGGDAGTPAILTRRG